MKLKILSGPFLGLEYNLECGDTVLQLVRDVATTASESGHALSTAHNVLLVATDGLQGRLIIRCAHADAESSAQVAEQGFDALMKGEEKVVAGSLKTKVQGAASKVMPDSVKAKMHERMAEPGSAK